MFRLLIFILIYIIFQKINKSIARQKEKLDRIPEQQPPGGFFTNLQPETPPRPQWQQSQKPSIFKKKIAPPQVKVIEPIKPAIKEFKQIDATEEEVLDLSLERVKEGIILSEILGPPKAYQICRGGGIGRRAGLKNR